MVYPERLTSGYYRVKTSWEDEDVLGQFRILSKAKAAADKNPGSFVFSNDGAAIYPEGGVSVEKASKQAAADTPTDTQAAEPQTAGTQTVTTEPQAAGTSAEPQAADKPVAENTQTTAGASVATVDASGNAKAENVKAAENTAQNGLKTASDGISEVASDDTSETGADTAKTASGGTSETGADTVKTAASAVTDSDVTDSDVTGSDVTDSDKASDTTKPIAYCRLKCPMNIRKEPSIAADKVAEYRKGVICEVLEVCGNEWLRISCPESETGSAYVTTGGGAYTTVAKGTYTAKGNESVVRIAENQGDKKLAGKIRLLNGLNNNSQVQSGTVLLVP